MPPKISTTLEFFSNCIETCFQRMKDGLQNPVEIPESAWVIGEELGDMQEGVHSPPQLSMSRNSSRNLNMEGDRTEIKSKFAAEFKRICISNADIKTYEDFKAFVEKLHNLQDIPFVISYLDPSDNDLLPINNDDNLARALLTGRPLLRLVIQRKGESFEELNGYGTFKSKNLISTLLGGTPSGSKRYPPISNPHDFRKVSEIIDVDLVPEAHRRVRLLKHGSDKPLGFYIRDGISVRVTPSGLEKMPGIFISRLVPGGLAESTGLLAVNDEVLEVNGIDVAGKTLDQVTDMMVANSSNLIITVKPANQRTTMAAAPRRGSFSRTSQMSNNSEEKFEEEDIVVTY